MKGFCIQILHHTKKGKEKNPQTKQKLLPNVMHYVHVENKTVLGNSTSQEVLKLLSLTITPSLSHRRPNLVWPFTLRIHPAITGSFLSMKGVRSRTGPGIARVENPWSDLGSQYERGIFGSFSILFGDGL